MHCTHGFKYWQISIYVAYIISTLKEPYTIVPKILVRSCRCCRWRYIHMILLLIWAPQVIYCYWYQFWYFKPWLYYWYLFINGLLHLFVVSITTGWCLYFVFHVISKRNPQSKFSFVAFSVKLNFFFLFIFLLLLISLFCEPFFQLAHRIGCYKHHVTSPANNVLLILFFLISSNCIELTRVCITFKFVFILLC